MKRLIVAALAGALAGALPVAAGGTTSKPGAVEGVWRTVEIAFPGPNGRKIANLQANLSVFAAKHYSRTVIESEGPRPVLADPASATADELRATWGPFSGEAGSYEISGDVITMRPLVAKNPAAMVEGAFTAYTFKLAGDTMWMTAQRSERGPMPNAPTIRAIRLE